MDASPASPLRARWAGMTGKLGLGFSTAGFLVILVAWNGAAGLDYTQGQVPYLISGGVGGLGLVIVGTALLIVESNRRDRAILERQLDELIAATNRLSPGAAATGNGHGSRVTVPADAGLVVAGRLSFHQPDCTLVGDRTDGDLVPRDQAEATGLAPCRVCEP